MLKPLISKTLGRLGYRLTRIPPDKYRLNPRFDQGDFEHALSVIKRISDRKGSGMPWAHARNYLRSRRASFYYEVLDVVEEADLLPDGARVLDVGVFFGDMLRILHKYHPNATYFGTETSDTRIAIAQELCPFATICRGTIDTLETDQKYQLVFLTEVLEHLADPDVALHKLIRLTENLFLTVPDGRYDTSASREYRPEWNGYLGHVNFWSPESWQHWLTRELPSHQIRTGKLPTGQLYAAVQKRAATIG